jgi:hypothetical protein
VERSADEGPSELLVSLSFGKEVGKREERTKNLKGTQGKKMMCSPLSDEKKGENRTLQSALSLAKIQYRNRLK